MAKWRVNHPYTQAQIDDIVRSSSASEIMLRGYVLRVQDGFTYIVPAKDATAQQARPRTASVGLDAFGELPAINKRKPADRVDSLMLKWLEDMKAAGTVPGLSDAKVSEIVGEAWKSGRLEVTTEMVKTVASHFLAKAERERAGQNYKRTVSI